MSTGQWALDDLMRESLTEYFEDLAGTDPFQDVLTGLVLLCGEVCGQQLVRQVEREAMQWPDVASAVAHTVSEFTHGLGQVLGEAAYAAALGVPVVRPRRPRKKGPKDGGAAVV